ncbi:MAG TPA: alpha-hydroxy-acid oxidizing protein, partial [Actinomycetota bacterium]|nr:alpha-hydroxy-acid oxidizing protein [Actinomycetota bacterium]
MSTDLLNVDDYARAARQVLPKEIFDYYDGGALDEITLRGNVAAWGRISLYYRVLAGVGPRDLGTTVLGQEVAMPVAVGPTAFHGLACSECELATA